MTQNEGVLGEAAAPRDMLAAAPASVSRGRQRRHRPRLRQQIAAICVLLLTGLIWDGARRTSTPPAVGSSLNSIITTTPRPGGVLRVAVFNIRGGRGMDEKVDLDRTVRSIGSCDLLALNEVHGASPFGGNADQAELLARKLNMPWLFAPSERRWWRDSFGNAVLCDAEVRSWQRLPISAPSARGCRSLLLLRVVHDGQSVNVLITHMERRQDREPELRGVTQLFLSLSAPAILMGDLNTTADDPLIAPLRHAAGVEDVLTRPGLDHRDVEWIFTKGFRCVDAGMRDEGASDHPLYWADLKLDSSQPGPQ